MNPNTHNNFFPPPQDDGSQPNNQPQQPYYGPPQIPTPQPQPYNPPPPAGAAPSGNQLPEQQYGAPESGQHQQYDFIMKDQAQRKAKSVSMPGVDNKALRITIMAAGVIVLILVVGTFKAILDKPSASTTDLVGLAQTQAELTRVAGIGATNGTSQTALNVSQTISLSVESDTRQLLVYLSNNHVKVNQKTLDLKKNTQTDARLGSALAASTFDSTFTDIIQQQLASYQKALKSAYNTNPGPNGQKLLAAQYKDATLLLTQAQQQ